MSKKVKASIKCPHCGCVFNTELYRSIWGEYPENKELVLSDAINVAHCPHCHKDSKLEFSLLYTNTPKNIAIWWEPNFDPQVDQDQMGYKMLLPDSHLAKAPRIKDWNEFKRKIVELEGDDNKFSSANENDILGIENLPYKENNTQNTNDNKSKNYTKDFIDIKLTLTALLFLVLALFDYKKCGYGDDFCYNFPYGFYDTLKFVICSYFLYRAYTIWQDCKIKVSFIVSLLTAIVYNPFVKMSFAKNDWYIINIITILIIIILSKNDFKETIKKYKETDEEETFLRAEEIVRKHNPESLKALDNIKENQPELYREHVYSLLYQQAQNKNKNVK